MLLDEALIRRLLARQETEEIEEDPFFLTEILNQPEGAEILVQFMDSEEPSVVVGARILLGMFDESALQAVVARLAQTDVLRRVELLDLLRTIISNYDRRKQLDLLQKILPQIMPLLDDSRVIEPKHEEGVELELESESRVCDEAYLLIQSIYRPGYNEGIYLRKDFEERDKEIRLLQNRFLIA